MLAETEAAQPELPHVGAGTSAEVTTIAEPNLELRLLELFGDFRGCGHFVFFWLTAWDLWLKPA